MDAQRYNQMGDPDLLDPRFREYYGDPNYHTIAGKRHNLYWAQEQAAGLTPPNLSMNGENEYFLTLDKELNRAWLGEIDSAKCAENAEDLWNDVTDKIGRDRQISDWKWLKPLYMFAQ
jgi:hypothetical protein